MYSDFISNPVVQKYTIPENISLGNHIITAIYVSPDNIRVIDSKILVITDDNPSGEAVNPDKNNKQLPQRAYNYINLIKSASLNTNKIIHNNEVIAESNVVTLETLNHIFGQTFTNGHLLVYVDGELVFNSTTTDDLSIVIFNIIEKFFGQHEIKVEFTDNNNTTNTYNETIKIK